MSKDKDSYNQSSKENHSSEKSRIEIDRLSSDNFPLDRYSPIELIGKGAAGNVFYCEDKVMSNRKIAVKVARGILSSHAFDYQKEAKATSKLNHPYIVKIYDCGITNDDIPYIAMEYIDGEPLEEYIAKENYMDPLEAILVFIKVCEALSYAHGQGVFHRDLKPANILLVPNDDEVDIKIIDFGIAYINQISNDPQIVQGKTIAGTPLYMSPDQLNNLTYDACSEVYSLGCIMFETLTGTPPFDADSSLELFSAHANLEIPLLSSRLTDGNFTTELQDFISTCLAKEKSNRFQNTDEVKQSLEELLEQYTINEDRPSVPLKIPSSTYRQQKKRYNKRNIGLLLFLLVAGIVGLFTILVSSKDSQDLVSKESDNESLVTKKNLPNSIDEFSRGQRSKNWYMGTTREGESCIFAKHGATDEDLESLAFKDPLQIARVSIPYSCNITGVGFKKLKNHPIFYVGASSKSLSDEGLKCICELKYLSVLLVAGGNAISNEGFKHFANAPNLKYLYIVHQNLTPDMVSSISEAKHLKQLGLYWDSYDDISSLTKLASLTKLDKLAITATNLEYIGFIAKLKNLEDLSLAKTQIDDEELKYLVNLKLKKLDIHDTNVSIKGLNTINKIKTLENLTVSLSNGISRAVLRNNINLPKCIINIHREKNPYKNKE